MASLQGDVSIGIVKETTYGTPVTVTLWPEFYSETVVKNINYVQGQGLRAGKVGDRADRRVGGKIEGAGDIVWEGLSKDLSVILQAWLGNKTDNGAGPYFHYCTPATTDVPPSYTVQIGIPLRDGGAVQPHTYQGGCVTAGTFTLAQDASVQISTTWTFQDMLTATALTAPSYTASQTLFGYHQVNRIALGGAITMPTTSAVGTGGTLVTNVRDFSFTWDNGLDQNGWNVGGAGKRTRSPAYGLRAGSGTFTAEFDATTLRDNFIAGTTMPLDLQITSSDASILELAIPVVAIEQAVPVSAGGDVITASVSYTVKENGTNPMVIAVLKNNTAT